MGEMKNNLPSTIVAFITGVAIIVITGLLLRPLVEYVADTFGEFDFSDNTDHLSKNDIILYLTAGVYCFICFFLGGLSSTLIEKNSPEKILIFMGLTASIFLIVIFFALTYEMKLGDYISLVFLIISIWAALYLCRKISVHRKQKTTNGKLY